MYLSAFTAIVKKTIGTRERCKNVRGKCRGWRTCSKVTVINVRGLSLCDLPSLEANCLVLLHVLSSSGLKGSS